MRESRGGTFTPQDIEWLIDVNTILNSLPWALKAHYYTKAKIIAARGKIIFAVLMLSIVAMAGYVFVKNGDPFLAIILIVYGILLGVIVAWRMDGRK